MNGLEEELRTISGSVSLSKDIAKHVQSRLGYGSIVIVTANPIAYASSIRKQWLKLIRWKQHERASTLDIQAIRQRSHEIAQMQLATFSVPDSSNESFYMKSVVVTTTERLLTFAPFCPTMYVATPVDRETLYKITSFMPEGALVVIYDEQNKL